MSGQDDTLPEANTTREEAWKAFARYLPAHYDHILPDLRLLYLATLNSLDLKAEHLPRAN